MSEPTIQSLTAIVNEIERDVKTLKEQMIKCGYISEQYRCTNCGEECRVYSYKTDYINDDYGYDGQTLLSRCCNAPVEEIEDE